MSEVYRCPRCDNVLSCDDRGIWSCASCRQLLRSYCRETGTEYEVVRRLFVDDSQFAAKFRGMLGLGGAE